ncbi:C6 transcription factor [Stagonosporopsis vannaccii]|nr:C6 transcription factor [Stagonosporopsis vannaccii]
MDADSKRIERVVLACIQCRSRHVKCDSNQPVCNRCRRDGKECIYQKSRRGGLNKEALARRRLKLQQEAEHAKQKAKEQIQVDEATSHNTPMSSSQGDDTIYSGRSSVPSLQDLRIQDHGPSPSATLSFQVNDERLLELYYEYFWPAFPIVLPQQYLMSRKSMESHGLEELSLVLEWIGSLYASWCLSEPYYQAALEAISSPLLPRTPFNVQAVMLFAIAQHHQDFRPESRKTLDLAILIALELDMNKRDFARLWGEGNPVLEESWRRTWYMLAISDQHFAIVMNTPIYQLADMPSDVYLPCDDDLYITGQIPTPATYQEMQHREFADVEVVYSSIAYLHDICRTVAYVMSSFATSPQFSRELIDTMDAKIAIWHSQLPSVKKDPMRKDGTVDEIIFMAHMIGAIVLMTLHRPLSSLVYSDAELHTTAFAAPAPFTIPATASRNVHTARALRVVEIQTKLLAIPCTMEKHSVFSMCICALIASAQVSACSNLLEDRALSIARDRVKLSIGFLNSMGSIWALGKSMAKDVRAIARSVLYIPSSITTVEQNISAEIEIPRDELIWPINPSADVDIYSGLVMPMDWEHATSGYASSALVHAAMFQTAGSDEFRSEKS